MRDWRPLVRQRLAALDLDPTSEADIVEELAAHLDDRMRELTAQGFTPVPSDANFVLFGRFADAHRAWQRYLDADVLIRDVGIPGHLRVTIGTPEENDAFLAASKAVSEEIEQ